MDYFGIYALCSNLSRCRQTPGAQAANNAYKPIRLPCPTNPETGSGACGPPILLRQTSRDQWSNDSHDGIHDESNSASRA